MDNIRVKISEMIKTDSIEYKSIKDSSKQDSIYHIASILCNDEDSKYKSLQKLKRDLIDCRIFEIPLNRLRFYHLEKGQICSYGGLFENGEIIKQSLNSTRVSKHQQDIFDRLEKTKNANLKSSLKSIYFRYISKNAKRNKAIFQDASKAKILFFCEYWSNFYHFIFEAYPRLILLMEKCKGLDCYIIAPPRYRKLLKYHQWFIDEMFECLGIGKDRILYLDYQNYPIQNVYYCSNPQCNSKYILPAIDRLKAYFMGGGSSGIGDRIYISRRKSMRRFLVNEYEITGILREQFGFKIVYMEDYSLREKINIMLYAKVVMSVEGTSLINGLFMNGEDSKLIALRSFDMTEHIFIISCMFKNISFLPIICDVKGKALDSTPWVEGDLYVDKDYLIQKLKEYEIEPIKG